MGHILESCFFFPSCLPKSLWEDGMAYQGVSMAIRGNVSGSQEFRPGKVLTDKQNEKVSSLASAIPSLFPLLSHLLTPAILSSVFSCSPPSSIFSRCKTCLIPTRAIYTFVCKWHVFHPPSFSTYLIFSLVLLLCSIFDIYFHPALPPVSHLSEPYLSPLHFFILTPLAPSCHLPVLDVNTFLSGGNIL